MGIKRIAFTFGACLTLTAGLVACGSSDNPSGSGEPASSSTTIVAYSGRGEEIIDPLLTELDAAQDGVRVEADYSGNTNAQLEKVLGEGDRSRADVFLGQNAAALGTLDEAGLLAPLPDDILTQVPEQYRAADGTWVATTARQRALVYNPTKVSDADLPTGIDGLLDPRWKGQIGYAPKSSSFEAFVTALRVSRGEDGARQWLTAFRANDPVPFEVTDIMMTAVSQGTITAGLANHFSWYTFVDETDTASTVALHAFAPGDPGALVNVSGVGVLASSQNKDAAFAFVRQLLSQQAQTYFANTTAEYPVIAGVESKYDLPPLDSITGAGVDLNQLASSDQTQALLTEVGII